MIRKKFAKPCLKTYGDVAELTLENDAAYRRRLSASGGQSIKWRKIMRQRKIREARP